MPERRQFRREIRLFDATMVVVGSMIGSGMGAIQVPSNGQPIVVMADAPTTGGYPKIGTVASADLPLLAQCVPGRSKIRFREMTVAKAQKKYRELMRGLDKIIEY